MRLTTCKLKHLWLFALALPLFFVASAADVEASTTPPRADVWQPNGPVYTIEMSKEAGVSRAYIGGDFTYVGPVTGNASAVIVAGANFPVITPSFNGPVHTTIAADNEGWYVGGNFSSVTDKDGVVHARNNLAQIDGEGNVMAWHPDLNGAVRALVYDGLNNRLYVGGDFTQVNVAADTQNRDYLAAFDTTVDLDSDTNWNPDLNGIVRALALDSANDRLYVGGDFTRVNVAGANLLRNRIVEFDVAALVDSPTIWNPDVNNTVRALAFDLLNNRLYAGGDFTQVNVAADPQTRNRLAVFDTQVSDDNAFNWNPDADNSVNALGLALGTIYVGGRFTAINGTARNGLVAIDITDITPVTFSNSNLLWGGTELPFIGADPSSLSVNQIVPGSLIFVAWEGQLAADLRDLGRLQALALDGTVAWTVDAAGPIYTARPSGDNILLGGAFNSGGGHIRSHLAEINLGTGVGAGTATNWSAFVDGSVYSIVARDDGNGLYIGGDFSNVRTATTARNNIALLSTSSGNVEDWDPSITGGTVRTMALSVDQATLYVGGQFSTVAGVGRQRIAALDTTVAGVAGAGVLTDWNPGPNPGADGDVHSLVVSNDGSLVFAAGDFSIIGGVARSRIAALKVANGTPLSNALWAVNSVNGVVRTLALSDDDSLLYLGGDFTSIDDGTTGSPYSRNRIAALEINGTSNQWSVATTIDPDVSAGTSVYSLDLSSDDRMLWVGGAFSALTSAPLPNAPLARGNVARYSLTEDSAIPLNAVTAWNPQLAGGSPPVYVTERTEDDGLVMVGGEFTSVAGAPHNYLALFDTLRPIATDHVAGGFYNTSPLDIILSCGHNSTAGPCSLFVTIDGSEPDQNSTEYLYTQPPPAPPVIPPPTTFDISAANTTVKFFARDAHGSVSDVITVDYGLDITFPETRAQPDQILPDVLPVDAFPEIADNAVQIALVCEDAGGANCDKTFYTTDGSDPHNTEDGSPSATASLYDVPLTPKQLLPLRTATLADLTEAEQAVFYDMTLADIISTEENAAFRIDLDAFKLGDIPRAAVSLNSIDLNRVRDYVDLAEIRLDSLTANLLGNVIAPENVPDDAVTMADLAEEDMDLTQITLGSISGNAYSLAEIPASAAPPPTYILASQVDLIQVFLDRSESDIVLQAVRLERVSLEQIPAEFIPGSRLYGLVNLQFFSQDRAGNSEVMNTNSIPANGPVGGVKSQQYRVDIGAPETTAFPNTGGNVFTSEIQVVLTCYDFEDVPATHPALGAVTGSGCQDGGTYYTLGGSPPDPDDVGSNRPTQVYTGPIPISEATVLRFMSVDNMGNRETAGFEIYAFTFSSVGQSGVGASGLAIGWLALLGLAIRAYLRRAAP